MEKPISQEMNKEKLLAEQQHGRNLYKKLMIDFREELQKGKIIGVESKLPEEIKQSIKVGIAFEALEHKDYRIAEAFFAQLGNDYKEWRQHAARLSLQETAKAEVKPLTLTDKLGRIDDPCVKFEYAKEKIREIAEKYPFVKEAIRGEATLEKAAETYEKEFNELCKLSKKNFRQNISEYLARIDTFEECLNEFITPKKEANELKDKKYAPKTIEFGNYSIMSGGVFSIAFGIGSMIISMVGGAYIPLSLVHTIILGGGVGGGLTCVASNLIGGFENQFQSGWILRNIKGRAREVDSIIQQAFIADFYGKDAKTFKEAFTSLNEVDQRYAVREILREEKSNKDANSWLIANYKAMIEEEGMANICIQEVEQEG